jgi:hypothetical protein
VVIDSPEMLDFELVRDVAEKIVEAVEGTLLIVISEDVASGVESGTTSFVPDS